MRTGSDLPTLEMALSLATKVRTRLSASDFCFRKYTCLKREWSSTSTGQSDGAGYAELVEVVVLFGVSEYGVEPTRLG